MNRDGVNTRDDRGHAAKDWAGQVERPGNSVGRPSSDRPARHLADTLAVVAARMTATADRLRDGTMPLALAGELVGEQVVDVVRALARAAGT